MRRPLLALALLIAGCSGAQVASDGFQLCRGKACRTLGEPDREELARGLYAFMRSAAGKDLMLSEAKPGETAFKGKGIRVFTQGGPVPAVYKGKAMRITDVLYLDLGEGVIKFKARIRGTWLFVPVLCAEGSGTIRILSGTQATLEMSNLCTWLGPTSYWKFEGNLDRLDLDEGLIGGGYLLHGAGLPVYGRGSGYMLAKVEGDEAEEKPAPGAAPVSVTAPVPLPVPVPAPAAPGPAPAEAVERLSAAPVATLSARLSEAGGDSVIDAGEAFTLKAEVTNAGVADAKAVRLAFSGTPALASALGMEKALGDLAPGAKAAVELKAVLPAGTPSQPASLRVEAVSGDVLLGAKTFKVALRGTLEESAEMLSELGVDEIPPATKGVGGPDDAALVVGISRYRDKDVPGVKYAARDAELVARYLQRVAGVPPENIKVLLDDSATKSDLEAYLTDWLPRRVKAGSRVFVYFAGHGTPGSGAPEPFLVPYEGQPDFPSKLVALKSVTAALAKLPAREAVVILDSCFSGAGGRSVAAPGARPLVTAVEAPLPAEGGLVVLSASSGGQVSSDYDKAKHGLFTWALLKGLRGEADRDGDGAVTVGELYGFAKEQVSRRASVELNRDQTPSLQPSEGAAGARLGIRLSSTKAR